MASRFAQKLKTTCCSLLRRQTYSPMVHTLETQYYFEVPQRLFCRMCLQLV